MKFQIDERFDASPEEVIAAFTDPDIYATYTDMTKIGPPEVLECTSTGDLVTLRLRMIFVAPLSAAARAVVDPGKLRWVQEEIHDLSALRTTVVFHPDHYADRFSCTGGYTFSEESGGTTRTLKGDLRIRMLLVGSEVERAFISGLREHAAEEQPIVERWLRSH